MQKCLSYLYKARQDQSHLRRLWWKGNSWSSYTGMAIKGADDTSRAMSWWESPVSWRIRRIPHKSHGRGRRQKSWKLKEKKESPWWVKRKWSADFNFGLGKATEDFWIRNFSARGRHWSTHLQVELAEGRSIPWKQMVSEVEDEW